MCNITFQLVKTFILPVIFMVISLSQANGEEMHHSHMISQHKLSHDRALHGSVPEFTFVS